MARWLLIPDAARALDLSIDTVRRRIRSGELVSRKDQRGRYEVEVEDAATFGNSGSASDFTKSRTSSDFGSTSDFGQSRDSELAHALELLDEIRRQRDQLEEQVRAQARQIEADASERSELRQLLGMHMQAAQARIAAPTDDSATDTASAPQNAPQRAWWRFWR